jgi:plasmid stabilization system protein ParE
MTSRALRDLEAICDHLSGTSSDFGERLLDRAHSLTTFPYRHGAWFGRQNIRKVPFESYIIFYKIDDDTETVKILRFRHAARDQSRLRLKEEPESYGTASQPAAMVVKDQA